MKHIICAIVLLMFINCGQLKAQQLIPLYPDGVPDPVGINERPGAYAGIEVPTLQVYVPEKGKETGTAIIIFPGGSYVGLAYREEGSDIGGYFAKQGIVAFVVKYRLPVGFQVDRKELLSGERYMVPLKDAQQAIKQVRMNASKWNIDSNKIGIIGFSAGGHVASSLATHFKQYYIPNKENTRLRPDFMILVYPVISMNDAIGHSGSRYFLLGAQATPERIKLFSNEEQVTAETPPTYLTHAGDDEEVKVDNSIVFYQSLVRHKVPVEMHLFPKGNHSFVLFLPPAEWMDPMLLFLKKQGFYSAK